MLEKGVARLARPSLRCLLLLLLLLQHCLLLLGCCLGHRRTEVHLLEHQPHIHPLVLAITQTLSDEVFCLCRHSRLVGELDLGGLENGVLLQDGCLALVVPKRLLAIEALVEDHSDTPTSTLEEILGGALPTTKHSGGRYQ